MCPFGKAQIILFTLVAFKNSNSQENVIALQKGSLVQQRQMKPKEMKVKELDSCPQISIWHTNFVVEGL